METDLETDLAYQYDEETREEIIDGRPTAMAPPMGGHNIVAENLYFFFRERLRGKPCRPFSDKWDLHLSGREYYIPDFMVVCDRDKIRPDGIHGAPDLVAEILSPSTARRDRGHKKDVYERAGVREYWIVSPMGKSVEQYVLTDGRFDLREVYSVWPGWMLDQLKPEERAAVPEAVVCAALDGVSVPLSEIFDGLIE